MEAPYLVPGGVNFLSSFPHASKFSHFHHGETVELIELCTYPFHKLTPDWWPEAKFGSQNQNETPLPHSYDSSYYAAQSFASIARLVIAVLVKFAARETQPGHWRSTLIQEASGKISEEVLICRFM